MRLVTAPFSETAAYRKGTRDEVRLNEDPTARLFMVCSAPSLHAGGRVRGAATSRSHHLDPMPASGAARHSADPSPRAREIGGPHRSRGTRTAASRFPECAVA